MNPKASIFLALIVVAHGLAFGQNPEPGAGEGFEQQLPTEAYLGVAENGIKVKLSVAINDTVGTSVTVDNASKILINASCWIDKEIMRVTGKAGNILTVIRGYDRTTAATHGAQSDVICGPVAADHNRPVKEIELMAPNILLCTSETELTIASDAITIPRPGCFSVDTEADAPTDDLSTINCTLGHRFRLRAEDDARTIVIKMPGTIVGVMDFSLDSLADSWEGWCRTINQPVEQNRNPGGA